MNDKVAEDVEDAKCGDADRVVRDGVDGESEGIETVMLEWNHEIFSGVPFTVFVESVLYD